MDRYSDIKSIYIIQYFGMELEIKKKFEKIEKKIKNNETSGQIACRPR